MDGDSPNELRPAEPFTVPVGEYVGRLRRQRRFLAVGLTATGVLVVAAGLLLPRVFVAEGTLALPDVDALERPEPGGEAPKPGISIDTFKKVDRALREGPALRVAFGREMSGREIAGLGLEMDQHILPLTSTIRDELLRIERDDSIVALRLRMNGWSPGDAESRVARLAALVRQRLVVVIVLDEVQAERLRMLAQVLEPSREILWRSDANRSLGRMSADLEALARRAGPIDGDRQVVNTAEGGHLFLPPRLQLVGAQAAIAENDHKIRVLRQRAADAEAKLDFFLRVSRLLDEKPRSHPAEETDWPGLVMRELEAVSRGLAPRDAEYLRVEAEGLVATLGALQSTIRWVETPSVRPEPRWPAILLALGGTALLVLVSALVRDAVSAAGRPPA